MQVIVDALKDARVKHCYGVGRDTLNNFATALSKTKVEFLHLRYEETRALAAQGDALLTNHR